MEENKMEENFFKTLIIIKMLSKTVMLWLLIIFIFIGGLPIKTWDKIFKKKEENNED